MDHSDYLRRVGCAVLGVLSRSLLAEVGACVKLLVRVQDCAESVSHRTLKRLFCRLHERGHVDAFYVTRAITVAVEAAAVAPLALLREAAAGLALTLMSRDWRVCEIVDGARASVEYLPVGRYCNEAVDILSAVPDGEERE